MANWHNHEVCWFESDGCRALAWVESIPWMASSRLAQEEQEQKDSESFFSV